MPKISKGKIKLVLNELSSEGILKEKIDPESIEDAYDLWGAIFNHCGDYSTEVWPEDFGTDCDAGEDYESVLLIFEKLSHGNIKYEDVESVTEGDKVELRFSILGNRHSIKFKQNSDMFSEDFLDQIIRISKDFEKGRIIEYMAGDVPEFAYLPHKVADILCESDLFN